MTGQDSEPRIAPRQRAILLATTAFLWIVLWLLYSSPLRTTYFFLDEILYLRPKGFPVLAAVWMPFLLGLSNGRPVSYFFWGIYLGIASNWNGMQWVRLMHFAVACTGASLFLYVLYRRSRRIGWALFVVLFICTQPLVQVCFAISIVTTYWFAAGIGCAAFLYLHRHRVALRDRHGARRPLIIAGLLLLVAWMTFQPGPFCGLALASYYALSSSTRDWPDERRVVLSFLAVLIATMVFYLAVYKLLLLVTGTGTYGLVNPAFSTLSGSSMGTATSFLRWTNYLGPFEWWNYPVAVEPITQERFQLLAVTTALVCMGVYLAALAIEARRSERSQVFERYGFAAFAVLLTFLPLIADGFTMRQHVYIACVPAIVVVVAHSLAMIVASLRPGRGLRLTLSALAVGVLGVVAWGARGGFERALVQPNARYYSFAREQVRRNADRDFTRVVVVAPLPGCPYEPCRGMHGYRMTFAGAGSIADSYRKIVQDETGRADVDVQFVRGADVPEQDPAGTIRIDYRELQQVESERPRSTATVPPL